VRVRLAATRRRFAGVKVHVATGEEEGRLSRRSVAALTGDERAATVELGGATVQIAYFGDAGPRSRGAKIGVTEALKSVPSCGVPADYSACRAALTRYIADDTDAVALMASSIQGTVVGVGNAFAALAKTLSLRAGEDLSGRLADVDALGARACVDGNGFDEKFRSQACAQTALESILIERFKISRVETVSLEIGAALEENDDLGPAPVAACAR
jgi:hypothetical protein